MSPSPAGAGPAPGPAVLVLAAGHGTRMGGPKALARAGGRTLLARILERCGEAGASVTAVVDPSFKARVLAALPHPLPASVRWVEADGALPMLASIQAGLRAAGPGGEHWRGGCWLWPVDAPFISSAGWRRAGARARAEPARILKLRADGRTGHPLWLPAWCVAPILAGDWADGLRGYLAGVPPGRNAALELPGEMLGDVNTAEALADAERRLVEESPGS